MGSQEKHPNIRFLEIQYWESDSLSKTTKLILLDSLLQEVCIKSGLAGRSPLSSLRLSVCLCQSQTSLFRTKESPLNKMIRLKIKLACMWCYSVRFSSLLVQTKPEWSTLHRSMYFPRGENTKWRHCLMQTSFDTRDKIQHQVLISR